MANEIVGSLKVLIGADTKALDSSLIAVNRKVSEFGTNIRNSGLAMTAGITAPLLLIGTAGFNLASDLKEVQNVVDKSFRENSGVIDKWSKGLLDSFGLGELSAKQYAGTFKAMSDGMEIVDAKGMEMATTLTEITGDMASFYNVRSDIANTALKSIFTGETESLKQFGIVMTEDNLNAFALAKGIKETYTEMDQAEKTTLRYEFVLDKMKNVMGDFALTSDSAANKMRLIEERAKQLGASIMSEAMPAIEDLLGNVDNLLKGFSGLDSEQKKTIITLGLIAAGIGPVLMVTGQLISSIGTISKALHTAKTAYEGYKIATGAATAAQVALNLSMSALPAIALIAGIAAISLTMNAFVGDAQRATIALREHKKAYDDATEAIDKQMESENAQSGLIDDLIGKYVELASKTSLTTDEKQNLKTVVEELNALLPGSIDLINGETTEYYNQIEALKALADARRADIDLQIKEKQALAAKERIITIDDDVKIAKKALADLEKNFPKWASGNVNELEALWGIPAMISGNAMNLKLELAKLQTEKEKLNAAIDEYINYVPPTTETKKPNPNPVVIPLTENDRVKAFEKARKNIEYLQVKEKWTTSKFYDELEKLRLQHLQNMTEDSEGYDLNRSTEVEVIKGREKPFSGSGSGSKTEETPYQRDYRNTKYSYETGDLTEAEYYDEIEKLKLQYLKAGSAEAQQIDTEVFKGRKALADAAAAETERLLAESEAAELKDYQDKYDNLKYLRDKDEISVEEYYNRLEQLRLEYLDSGSDLDRQAEIEVLQGRKALLAAQQKDIEDMVKESKTGLEDLNLSAAETSQKVKDKFNISANLGEFQSIIEGLASGEYSNEYSVTKGYVNSSDYSRAGSSSLQAASVVININDANFGIDAKEAAEDLAVELVDKLRNAGIIT